MEVSTNSVRQVRGREGEDGYEDLGGGGNKTLVGGQYNVPFYYDWFGGNIFVETVHQYWYYTAQYIVRLVPRPPPTVLQVYGKLNGPGNKTVQSCVSVDL